MSGRVRIVLAIGQSNMSGRGVPIPDKPEHPRVWQFPLRTDAAFTLVRAAEPLIMHDEPTGVGPALEFARHLAESSGAQDQVVIVPAAHGGTMLSTDDSLGWRWGVPGNLAESAVDQTRRAFEAAQRLWSPASVDVSAALWIQGESDGLGLTSAAAYREDLENLIGGIRNALGRTNFPFIIGQMCPEGLNVGTRQEIDAVHRAMPDRLPEVGFVIAPTNMHKGDDVHFNAAAQELIAERMYAEYVLLREHTAGGE